MNTDGECQEVFARIHLLLCADNTHTGLRENTLCSDLYCKSKKHLKAVLKNTSSRSTECLQNLLVSCGTAWVKYFTNVNTNIWQVSSKIFDKWQVKYLTNIKSWNKPGEEREILPGKRGVSSSGLLKISFPPAPKPPINPFSSRLMLPKKENSPDPRKSHDASNEISNKYFKRLTKLGIIMFWMRMIARNYENKAFGVDR